MSTEYPNLSEAKLKLEHYCAYQDRCHDEVIAKLRSLRMTSEETDLIVVHLIDHNFLNEERFACSFARGKHRIKYWGKIRIVNELKSRHISQYNINTALKEITIEEYSNTFDSLATRTWDGMTESNTLKRRKKFCDFLLRKGYESGLVWEKVKELENEQAAIPRCFPIKLVVDRNDIEILGVPFGRAVRSARHFAAIANAAEIMNLTIVLKLMCCSTFK